MYNDIIHFLDQKRLKEGFIQLKASAVETDNWKLQSDIENLQTTYDYMLQYAAKGQADPERARLFNELRCTGYELADRTEFIKKYSKGYGDFSDKFREFKFKPARSYEELGHELSSLEQHMQISNLLHTDATENNPGNQMNQRLVILDELFNKTWVSTHWSKEDFKEACELSLIPGVGTFDLSVFVSAVTLNLMLYFDPLKFQYLLNLYLLNEDVALSQRTLIGIALCIYYHENRIKLYPNLIGALSLLKDKPNFERQLNDVQVLFLVSRETEKIDKKMREEILPQIINNPHLANPDLKINEIDLSELEEKNPEWEDDINQISEHIRELGKLQKEGADTYMSTFSQLKSYPFFREAAHWFYPFNKDVPEISKLFSEGKVKSTSFLGTIFDSPIFCNSDKYSLCLTLKTVPEQQIQMMSTDLKGEADTVREQLSIDLSTSGKNNDRAFCRQYVQDLYRFFKIWSFRQQQHDIFTDKLTLWKCETLRSYVFMGNHEKEIADYLFTKGYLAESAELYQDLSETIPNVAEIKQKLGFALQKMKRYEDAVKAYEMADILKTNDAWTLKHMAQCYKRMNNYEKALKCFQQVETLEPDNLNLALQIGQCLATLRSYNQALTYFFKVEYLGKAPENARRAIGWCYFMTGKYEEAARFYGKIIDQATPGPEDWLNYGHIYLAQQDMKHALECYRKAADTCMTHDDFVNMFMNDQMALLEQGITEESLYITLDLILKEGE